jgi:hypothetical protein
VSDYANEDVVIACADLVGRCGASGFEIGYLHDGVPVEDAGWHASAQFRGARIMVEDHRSPTGAALALAERLLRGAACRCRQPVTLSDGKPGCRWRLVGKRWEPGCDAEPIHVKGQRGDYAAMVEALNQHQPNRAARRAAKKRNGGRRG